MLVPSPSPSPRAGGTIYVLTDEDGFGGLTDPQRITNPEELAFFSGTIYRSLETYVYSPDPIKGTTLQPDMATDLGTPSDGGRTWMFTLRPGLTWQDGSAVTCADVAYGVSRAFEVAGDNIGGSYAAADLDIPRDQYGQPDYVGPWRSKPAQQALFNKAVSCSPDDRTITFQLNAPHADFNATTTLGFQAVPDPKRHPGIDPGEQYGLLYGGPDALPWSAGPYVIQRYDIGPSGKMVLVRNPNWNRASDPIRPAYPDRWEVDFGLDAQTIDQRLIASSGNDAFALAYDPVARGDLGLLFSDPHTPAVTFAGRAVSSFDPYTQYLWINVQKVKDRNVRLAIAAAVDRNAIRNNLGGSFYGDFADGALKPTLGTGYAPTGFWTASGPFGQNVPTSGDPNIAKAFLARSGVAGTTIDYNFYPTPTRNTEEAIVASSLAKAGITVKPNEIDPRWCSIGGCPPILAYDAAMGNTAWGPAWSDASAVIGPLFGPWPEGWWNVSHVADPAFDAAAAAATATLDPAERAAKWQALNTEAVDNAWIVPLFFTLSQHLAGTKVGPIYRWAAYSSWPYGAMYVTP